MENFISDTEKLITLISKKGDSISDLKIRSLAEKWISNYSANLQDNIKKYPQAYNSLAYLIKSVNNYRISKRFWLKNLKKIRRAFKEENIINPGKEKKEFHKNNITLELFNGRKFHPSIVQASKELFESKHYSPAIFEACKLLNKKVQEKSESNLDGKNLMLTVFTPNGPKLKLNQFLTQSDKDEQEGFMHIFAGVMQGIRNPKGHDIIKLNNPVRALEYLSFLSLLFRKLDESISKKSKTKIIHAKSVSRRTGE